MEIQVTDMPFKLANRTIVIVRDLPVLQCTQCGKHVIEDSIKKKVDALLEKVDPRLELEIVEFSAKECREDHIYEKVVKALQTFFIKDRYLLDNDVHEVTISHKLAEYLQYQFPDMNVDCEYNRQVTRYNGDNIKRRSDTGEHVRPDIPVERTLRGVAISRKNFLFAGNDAGGERAAAIYTLIETALCR